VIERRGCHSTPEVDLSSTARRIMCRTAAIVSAGSRSRFGSTITTHCRNLDEISPSKADSPQNLKFGAACGEGEGHSLCEMLRSGLSADFGRAVERT
jgi:hypothetical protein